MPYIKAKDRTQYTKEILEISSKIREFYNSDPKLRSGHLNYVITSLLLNSVPPIRRYADYNEIIGVLECVKQEFYRRSVAPYEDEKIKDEGDLF